MVSAGRWDLSTNFVLRDTVCSLTLHTGGSWDVDPNSLTPEESQLLNMGILLLASSPQVRFTSILILRVCIDIAFPKLGMDSLPNGEWAERRFAFPYSLMGGLWYLLFIDHGVLWISFRLWSFVVSPSCSPVTTYPLYFVALTIVSATQYGFLHPGLRAVLSL